MQAERERKGTTGRFIPPRIHGMADYLLGALLVLPPWLFGFADGGAEARVPVVLGVGVALSR